MVGLTHSKTGYIPALFSSIWSSPLILQSDMGYISPLIVPNTLFNLAAVPVSRAEYLLFSVFLR